MRYNNASNIYILQGIVKTGKATKDMYDKMSAVESIIKERMQDFIESAHKYNGDSARMV